MKTATITLSDVKDSDGWHELAHEVAWDKFKRENPQITDEDELNEKFYEQVVSAKFQYGEYANLEIIVDENFNIVGGKIL